MQQFFFLLICISFTLQLNAQNEPANYIELKQNVIQPDISWTASNEQSRVHPSPIIVGAL